MVASIVMGFNSPSDVLSLIIWLQLGGALLFVLSGLYVLYCLNRAATGIDRLADVAEAWLLLQQQQAAQREAQLPPKTQISSVETPGIEPGESVL